MRLLIGGAASYLPPGSQAAFAVAACKGRMMLRIVLLAGVAAAAFASVAGAQDAAGGVRVQETVVVTGVRSPQPRTALDTPAPVDVVGADRLQSAAAAGGELGAALQATVPSFNLPRQSNSGPADVVRAAQLRGMSPDQVLVLVNGKRRHTTSVVNLESKQGRGSTPVDFNAIPVSAIKRVEVLRDGAGAQYGSDAIAGVINVILDDARSGAEFTALYGSYVTSFEPTNQDITDGETVTATAEGAIPLGANGFIRFGGEFKDRGATNRAGFDTLPFFEDQGPANRATIGRRNYRPGDSKVTDVNLWANAEIGFGGDRTGYGWVTFNDRDALGAAFFRYPVSSGNVRAIFPNGYRPDTTGANTDIAVTGGVRGALGGWSTDFSISYGRNEYDFGLNRSLNPSLGAQSPTSFNLAGYAYDQLSLNIDAFRTLGDFGFHSPLTLATGIEHRREGYQTSPGDPASYQAGPVVGAPIGAQAGPGLRPQDAVDLDRSSTSLYAELSTDVTEALFVDAALRYENYSDFGDALVGKLVGRLSLADGFALRASASTSFRAPSLAQTGFRFAVTSFGAGGRLTTINTLAPNDPIARALGARDLDAETSTNLGLGFTWIPLPELSISVDGFQIDVDDRITLSERVDVPAALAARLGWPEVTAANFFTNAVDTRTKGVDLVVSYGRDLAGGDLNLSAAYNWSETEIRRVRPGAVPGAVLLGVEERNTLVDAAPKDKVVLAGEWQGERFGVTSRAIRYGETRRVFNFGGGFEPDQTYGAKWQLDLEGSFRLTEQVTFAIGANNLLDEYPDRSSDLINYFGNFPYDVISPIGFNGRFVYARTKVTF
jgi:iron complex outermembrane receptor protein